MRWLKSIRQKLSSSNDDSELEITNVTVSGISKRATRLITARDGAKNDEVVKPPFYTTRNLDKSTMASLDEVAACSKMGGEYGIADPFNAFSRRWLVYINVNKHPTKDAYICTKLQAEFLLNLGNAHGTEMSFWFPTISNEEHPELTADALENYRALREVTYSKSFDDARMKVQASETLKNLDIEAVIKEFEDRTKDNRADKSQGNYHPGKLKKNLPTTADMFRLFLYRIYGIMAPYMRGWDRTELTPEMLAKLIDDAYDGAAEHTVFGNHQRVMYERMITLWASQREAEDSHPTTAFYITESPMEGSELRSILSIIDEQQEIGGELETEVSEFVIQTLAWIDKMDTQHRKNFKILDDKFKGKKKDILDVTFVSADFYRRFCGPSGKLWLKLLYGHLKAVDDKLKFPNEKDKYTTQELGPGEKPMVPQSDDIREILGMFVRAMVGNEGRGEQSAPSDNDKKG